jgi:hypothetical protein
MNTTSITHAEPARGTVRDLQAVVDLVEEAARWLRGKGTDQWAVPWPSKEARDERIRTSLASGSTWILRSGSTPVATITCLREGLERLWMPEEREIPALYVHRLVVSRQFAHQQIGARLIRWAEARARRGYGARFTRVDVWTTNDALHQYYKGIGFEPIRYADDWDEYPSCALFQRRIRGIGRPRKHFAYWDVKVGQVQGVT